MRVRWCSWACGGRFGRFAPLLRLWSLVFGGAALVSVVALVLVFLCSGCILYYFANVSKMGSAPTHPRAYAHAYPRNNF